MKPRLGLSFEIAPPRAAHPNRTDIVGFVGAVSLRAGVTEPDFTVALESFEDFDARYAWDERAVLDRPPQADDPRVVTPLGAAVRAFFAEGGQRCHVIRSGDAVALLASQQRRFTAVVGLRGLRPRFEFERLAELQRETPLLPLDAAQWQGLERAFALPELSLVCLPDLVDVCVSVTSPPGPAAVEAPPVEEIFRESFELPVTPQPQFGRRVPPPRLDENGLRVWAQLVEQARALLDNGARAFNRRDLMLLASVPLAERADDGALRPDWFTRLPFRSGEALEAGSRVQLAYPWLGTRASGDCPGGVEAPEGTLAGVLARSALARGSFRTAAREPLRRVLGGLPLLDPERMQRDEHELSPGGRLTAADRLCLLLSTPRGPALVSDVTLSPSAALRPGSVRRLMGVVLRAARAAGEEFAFEANGEALWQRLRQRFSDLGRALLDAGALHSDAGREAFVVRCGRDTMRQNDLDAGRLIAEIELIPAQPITRIVVSLSLRDGVSSLRAAA